MRRSSPRRRSGLAALDVLLAAVVTLTIAAGGYAIARTQLDSFFFTLSNAVGWPLL